MCGPKVAQNNAVRADEPAPQGVGVGVQELQRGGRRVLAGRGGAPARGFAGHPVQVPSQVITGTLLLSIPFGALYVDPPSPCVGAPVIAAWSGRRRWAGLLGPYQRLLCPHMQRLPQVATPCSKLP